MVMGRRKLCLQVIYKALSYLHVPNLIRLDQSQSLHYIYMVFVAATMSESEPTDKPIKKEPETSENMQEEVPEGMQEEAPEGT